MTPKEEYQQNGFLIVRNLLTPEECTEMKREIQRILQEKKDYGGVLVGLAATSAVFQAAAHHPKLLDAIESVIGSDILFLSDKVVFKSSDVRFASPWHQDWHYWKGAHKLF
ncbi:MAG: phytanoyl-CoA dioxygenase family protein, partial [bacterium]